MIEKAVRSFWLNRNRAKRRQTSKGIKDVGQRSGVTAGKNMDGFVEMIEQIVKKSNLTDVAVHKTKKVLTLPGYFRPTKQWDVLITSGDQLIAALEFKSQVGPSFGNNFNNRCEEALGAAKDFWVAYREGAFGDQPQPFLGWLMLLEDTQKSATAVKASVSHFEVDKIFKEASYAKRYQIFCERLIKEKLYTNASLILSPSNASRSGHNSHLSNQTSTKALLSGLVGRLATAAD